MTQKWKEIGISDHVRSSYIDHLENFLRMTRPQDREILELCLQGFGTEEIAKKLDISDRSVRRVFGSST